MKSNRVETTLFCIPGKVHTFWVLALILLHDTSYFRRLWSGKYIGDVRLLDFARCRMTREACLSR